MSERQVLRLQKHPLPPPPARVLSASFVDRDVSSQLFLLPHPCCAIMDSNLLEQAQLNTCIRCLGCPVTVTEK